MNNRLRNNSAYGSSIIFHADRYAAAFYPTWLKMGVGKNGKADATNGSS
jgi:hypothetical protein